MKNICRLLTHKGIVDVVVDDIRSVDMVSQYQVFMDNNKVHDEEAKKLLTSIEEELQCVIVE